MVMGDLQKWLNMKWKQEQYRMSKKVTLDELIEILKEGTTVISFEKLDGSMRVMNATLDPDVIPDAPEQTESKVEKSKSDKKLTALPVWDIQANGWRSFCLANLKTISAENVTYVD